MIRPTRVVSLVPSITETLLAWDVTPLAVTRFCETQGIATVGGTKNPDVGAIVSLNPDLVLMDEEENRAEDAGALRAAGITVHATRVRSLQDANEATRTLAGLFHLKRSIGVPDVHTKPGLRTWIPIWRRPWMTINADTYGSDLLAAAGFDNVFADHAERYPRLSAEDVVGRRPDLVLAPSEPYPFSERHRPELERMGRVEFVDGRDLFWWGARTPAALRRVQALAGRLSGR